jgi:phage regulator Rha-like protein
LCRFDEMKVKEAEEAAAEAERKRLKQIEKENQLPDYLRRDGDEALDDTVDSDAEGDAEGTPTAKISKVIK